MIIRYLLILSFLLSAETIGTLQKGDAQSLTSHLFDQSSGLDNLDPMYLVHSRSDAMLVATQQDTRVFDGHHFLTLGSAQGLTFGVPLDVLKVDAATRTILAAEKGVLLVAPDPAKFSLEDLRFTAMPLPVAKRFRHVNDVARFGAGTVVVAGNSIDYFSVSGLVKPDSGDFPPEVTRANRHISDPLRALGGHADLWVARKNGEICVYGPTGDKCWGSPEGLPARAWGPFLSTPTGVMTRTGTLIAIVNRNEKPVKLEAIPDTSTELDIHAQYLPLLQAPDRAIMTATIHGVATWRKGQWRPWLLTSGNYTIVPAALGAGGSIWLGMLGEGIRQFNGYGAIENWTWLTGLANSTIWGVRRDAQNRLWVASDAGLERMDTFQKPEPASIGYAAQGISRDSHGNLWLVVNANTLERYDTRTGAKSDLTIDGLAAAQVGPDDIVWVACSHGLYTAHADVGGSLIKLTQVSSALSPTNLLTAPDGTVWITGDGALWRKLPGDIVRPVVLAWGQANVIPVTLARESNSVIWVGTMDGLFRVEAIGHPYAVTRIPAEALPSQTISALLIDHKHNLWVGTPNGIAVRHAGQWATVNQHVGLVGDDIDQDSLFEDHDGTIWVGASQGLSHIINPEALWGPRPLEPVFQRVLVDGKRYSGGTLPPNSQSLEAWVGLFNTAAGTQAYFRYRLRGIDRGWQSLSPADDRIYYPLLPHGTYTLDVVAVDPLLHTTSPAISLTLHIAYPWWRQTWALAGFGAIAGASVWLLLQLWTRMLRRQRALLQRKVDEQTALLSAQATQDALTGLLNRGAVQDALTKALRETGPKRQAVALIDVDHFKRLNDTHGHLVGDAVLAALGARLRNHARAGDVVGRFGGEEYIVVVPGNGGAVLSRLRGLITAVTSDPVAHGGQSLPVTVSAGIAMTRRGDTWETIVGRADAALYQAKRAGRNRTVIAEVPEPGESAC